LLSYIIYRLYQTITINWKDSALSQDAQPCQNPNVVMFWQCSTDTDECQYCSNFQLNTIKCIYFIASNAFLHLVILWPWPMTFQVQKQWRTRNWQWLMNEIQSKPDQ